MSDLGAMPNGSQTIPVRLVNVNAKDQVSDSIAPPRVFAGATVSQLTFSFAAMLGTCLIGRVFLSLRSFKVDPDVWWHIKIGEGILATHHWPTADPYSFTVSGQHWLAYEWLGDVLLAAVSHVGGLRGLGALLIILGSLVALALYYYTTMRCGNPKAGFLAAAVLLNLATGSFNLRPQMLGYLFLILTLIVLERFRQGKRRTIWLLPFLMLIWINTHGTWIIGLATIGVYLVSGLFTFSLGSIETLRWTPTDRRRLAVVLVLCCAATLITPYGTGLARYPFEVASSLPSNVTNVQEWKPMGFQFPGDKLFLGLVLGFLLVQMLSRRKWRLEELGLFLVATVMVCLHIRFLLIFVPFFAPLFAVILARWLPKYDRAKEIYALNAAVMVAVLAAMVWFFPSRADYTRIVGETYPVEAVQYLESHSVPSPMFNTYGFGGYLVYSRAPEHKVFIDGRGELYERGGVFTDYVRILNLKPGSLAVLQAYGIQSCLLWHDEPLATVLAAMPDWEKVYSDNTSVIFVRRKAQVLGSARGDLGRDSRASTAPTSSPKLQVSRQSVGVFRTSPNRSSDPGNCNRTVTHSNLFPSETLGNRASNCQVQPNKALSMISEGP